VVDDVVVRQRLLDQQQVEVVQRPEGRDCLQRVRRVGVDLEQDAGIPLAHPADDSTTAPGAIFKLDAAVALAEVLVDQVVKQRAGSRSMPRLTRRDDLRPRVPPSSSASGLPRSGQRVPAAISRPAWRSVPLDRAIEPDQVVDVSHSRPGHRPRKSRKMCQQVSVVSGQ
jgi:hypothetical protein